MGDILKDPLFRSQYDSLRPDPEVEALLAGIEPPKQQLNAPEFQPRMDVSAPRPQFKWLKPLR